MGVLQHRRQFDRLVRQPFRRRRVALGQSHAGGGDIGVGRRRVLGHGELGHAHCVRHPPERAQRVRLRAQPLQRVRRPGQALVQQRQRGLGAGRVERDHAFLQRFVPRVIVVAPRILLERVATLEEEPVAGRPAQIRDAEMRHHPRVQRQFALREWRLRQAVHRPGDLVRRQVQAGEDLRRVMPEQRQARMVGRLEQLLGPQAGLHEPGDVDARDAVTLALLGHVQLEQPVHMRHLGDVQVEIGLHGLVAGHFVMQRLIQVGVAQLRPVRSFRQIGQAAVARMRLASIRPEEGAGEGREPHPPCAGCGAAAADRALEVEFLCHDDLGLA